MKIFYTFKNDIVKDDMVVFEAHNYYDQQNLNLLGSNQGHADITDFVTSELSLGTLKHLKVIGSLHIDFGNVCLRACLVGPDQPLNSLRIQYNNLNDSDAKNISDILSINYSLKSLSLQGNLITDLGIKQLACSLLGNNSLRLLDLSFNFIGDSGVEWLAAALMSNCTITFLDLTANSITAKGAKYFGGMLTRNNTLKTLQLGANNLEDEGAHYIAEGLKINKSLTEIDLRCSEIHPDGFGIRALKKCLLHHNFKIKILKLYVPSEKEAWANSQVQDIELYVEQTLSLAGDNSSSEEGLS